MCLKSIAIELYHLVRWHEEGTVSVVPDTQVTRHEASEANDCLAKWGKEQYSATIVASGKHTAVTIDIIMNDIIRI